MRGEGWWERERDTFPFCSESHTCLCLHVYMYIQRHKHVIQEDEKRAANSELVAATIESDQEGVNKAGREETSCGLLRTGSVVGEALSRYPWLKVGDQVEAFTKGMSLSLSHSLAPSLPLSFTHITSESSFTYNEHVHIVFIPVQMEVVS